MTTRHDQWGVEMTARSAEAAHHFDELVAGYYTFAPDMPQRMAAAGDSGAPLSLITNAQFLLMSHTPDGARAAASLIDAADRLVGNDRERDHLRAVRAAAAGQVDELNRILLGVLDEHPTDALAARLVHFTLFNRGDLDTMRDTAATSATVSVDLPYGSFHRSTLAFALEETGALAEAEAVGREAVSQAADDLWGVHAVSHALEMQGDHPGGLDWLVPKAAQLDEHGSFAGHVWWHRALFHLETGDHTAAAALYDDRIAPGEAIEGLTITNAIALLARLEFAGFGVEGRWVDLVAPASLRLGVHSHPFNDCHFAYALARAGRDDLAERLLEGMRAWIDRGDTAAEVIADVGLNVASGMIALANGDARRAVEHLAPSRSEWWRLGGSHAQRDLFAQALLRATIDADRGEDARRLAQERLDAKPASPRNHVWLADAVGGTTASGARDRAHELGWSAA